MNDKNRPQCGEPGGPEKTRRTKATQKNRYPGHCNECGHLVAAKSGVVVKVGTTFIVYC